jgi:hypothetical protein
MPASPGNAGIGLDNRIATCEDTGMQNSVEIIATVTYDTDEDGSFVVAEVFTTARGTGYRGIFVDEDNVARPISQSITFYASPDAAIAAALVA